jgi:DNA mismatch repair protein MutS
MGKKQKADLTPLMKQYYSFKAKHPDAILLFRVGDFYETFEDDAIKTSQILGITLTKRANGSASYVDLAGFPYHALDNYLPKLVKAGERVAICEQLEDPKLAKGIVKRGIVELVTPGVSYQETITENKSNIFLASIYKSSKDIAGVSFLDLTTGEFYTTEGTIPEIQKLIFSYNPKEIIYYREQKEFIEELTQGRFYIYPLEDWVFNYETCYDKLISHFKTHNLKGFGIEFMQNAIIAAGAILHYLSITEHEKYDHITSISRIDSTKFMWLDHYTIRNLELFSSIAYNGKTFFETIDFTTSPMGGRLLRKWITFPLINKEQIQKRLDATEALINDYEFSYSLKEKIREIADLERLVSRISSGRITPREVVHLKNSLKAINAIKELWNSNKISQLEHLITQLNSLEKVSSQIENTIVEDAPTSLGKSQVIKDGANAELDELRNLVSNSKEYLNRLLQNEMLRTGIPNLKLGFNNVFGYYLEVRNTHKNKVPEDWIRKQTLVSSERYITPELKEYEAKILGAEEKILALETNIYNNLVASLLEYIPTLQVNSSIIAQLDVLLSFAQAADKYNYVKPEVNDSLEIAITNGRHPVIEQQLPVGEEYVPNSVLLNNNKQQIMIITGPNMAGKSALLRQTALIVIMAQIGSFVPASKAKIGIVDKVFTRVGASDNLSQGESTFMVEMTETASILNNLSPRSLVLLDEIGRGTSTYDGISIAWAITEYLHENMYAHPKTMFATHYHELNDMEKFFPRIKNYHVSVREVGENIVFERKLKPGGTEHSFGIHVAEMAGIPKIVINRAKQILKQLEKNKGTKPDVKKAVKEPQQIALFQMEDPDYQEIKVLLKDININETTPVEALNLLSKIFAIVKRKK